LLRKAALFLAITAVLFLLEGSSHRLIAQTVEGMRVEDTSPLDPAESTGPVNIVRIIVDGNERLSEEAVSHLMRSKVGDTYDPKLLRQDFKRIWDRGLLEDLSIETRDVPGGKAIILHVVEKPVINDVTYEKSKVVGESQIEDAMSERKASIDIGEPIDLDAIKKAEETIKTLLGQKGYLDGEAKAQIKDSATPGSVDVHFDIEEGPRTRIRAIRFTGNTVFSNRRLKKALKLTKEKGLFTRISGKDIYHPQKLDQDLRNIETLYHNQGYIELELKPADVKIVEEKESDKPGKSRKWVEVIQPLDEGVQFRVGEIKVTGNTVFTEEEIRKRIPLAEGAILNNALLQAGLDFIEAEYGQRGYLYISTNRIIDRKPDQVADITIRISEDKPYRIGRIDFTGNTVTRDFVLRREMQLSEEDLLDIRRLRLGLRRINQLGYFQIQKEPVIEPIEGTDRVNVSIEGVEQRRSELQVGGGFSGLDGGFFTSSYQTRNFLGRGNIVSFNAQAGSTSTRYILSFTEPYFLGRPLLLGFSLFRRTTNFVDFDSESFGGSLTLGYRFKVFHQITGAYLFQDTDFNPITGATSRSRTSSVRPAYQFNTINNPFRPSRGFLAVAAFEYAGGELGGDNFFIKPLVRMTKYVKSWKRTFWAFHAEAGYAAPFNDRQLPTFERFFMGGERSLRIFETRTIAPLGFVSRFDQSQFFFQQSACPSAPTGIRHTRQIRCDVFRIGGNKMLLFNAEYVFPTEGPVDFAIFLDAGNVFLESENIELSELRKDAGLEMRFFLPVFGAPLRLIYGFNLDAEEGDKKSSFVFSVGTTF
jgi:outer membrane protein insertion porin family